MENRRRPSGLLAPGDTLLFCRAITEPAHRLKSFSQTTGLGYERMVSTPLCAIPLPRYDGPERPTRVRWADVNPEALWSPLFWLPPRLHQRFRIGGVPGGGTVDEGDDLWAIRMSFELSDTTLYDQETGTWLDVLATVGLDSEDDLDQARVRDWLSGVPDPLLDSIDLTPYLAERPASWALEAAVELRDDLVVASWAILSNDFAAIADSGLNPEDKATGAEAVVLVRWLAGMGAAVLREAPGEDGTAAGPVFEEIARSAARGEISADAAPSRLAQMRDLAYAVRERCWPVLDALSEAETLALNAG